MKFIRTAAALLLACLAGLGTSAARESLSYASAVAGKKPGDQPLTRTEPKQPKQPEAAPNSDDVARAATEFSLDVAKDVLHGQRGNGVVSALGVGLLLSLLQQGSDVLSDTSGQLEKALHMDRSTAAQAMPSLLRNAITKKNSQSTLEAGNRLFTAADSMLKPNFVQLAQSNYDTDVTKVDFKQPAEAANTINQWVEQATHGRIRSLVSPGALSARASLVMASATYFRGVWLHKFDKVKTVPRYFSATPNHNVTVYMMAQMGDFRAGDFSDLAAQWLELPFDGDHFSMILVLPNQRHGLDAVLQKLTAEHLMDAVTSPGPPRGVLVLMPRFTLNSDVSLGRTLKQLGVTAMFTRNAKLRDVAETPVVISDVVHKAEMKVDEEGATASAASAVLVNTLSLVSISEDMKFFADHPFLAIIMDRTSKVPIFIGRVSSPNNDF